MALLSNRSWQLQNFVAHNANVNCLALGHKSGRVMVTGGDDKKVNLWAIGKPTCFMSLSGHITPIECVQFNQMEELVCAGSRAGALKIWDLEAAKLVRTLSGHKFTVKSTDFHPYGDFLASGSADSSIKLWDMRKKGVIFTYNGHKLTVNNIKFSPDGNWIASGGEDSTVKIWDLRVGRVLHEFTDHANAVTCVEFHPHEFLLASGSADRSVNFFDLENFNLVSSGKELGAVRCLCFNPDGDCLYTGVRDHLKIVGWEPNRLYDSVSVNWAKVCDISTAQNQLVGASFLLNNVQVYVVDLQMVKPFCPSVDSPTRDTPSSPFSHNQSIRKSFSKAERPVSLKSRTLDVKTIEESTSGTDPEEENAADITNLTDYNEIFKGHGLSRTPPPEPEPFREPVVAFQEPERLYPVDPTEPQILGIDDDDDDDLLPCNDFEALSLDNNLNNHQINSHSHSPPTVINAVQYSRSKSNLDQVYVSRLSKQHDRESTVQVKKFKGSLHRQNSCKEVPEKLSKSNSIIKHSVSEVNINNSNNNNNNGGSMSSRTASRKNSFSKPSRTSSTSTPNMSKIPNSQIVNGRERKSSVSSLIINPVDIYVSSKLSPDEQPNEEDEFVPVSMDRPVGLALEDFLPKNHHLGSTTSVDMSEAEVLSFVNKGHDPMMEILQTRQRTLQLVLAQYRSKDLKACVEMTVAVGDIAILVDILGVINCRPSAWNLDICVSILPKLLELLQSKYEAYITVGCASLTLILKHFGYVIKDNIQSPVGGFGVDISREERFHKSQKCYEMLCSLQLYIKKKQNAPGVVGSHFKDILSIMDNILD